MMLQVRDIWVTLLLLFGVTVSPIVQAGEIVVTGVGYPPVRAMNKTQALLMAKRAAIINAYANAVQESDFQLQDNHDIDGAVFYQQISGFIKGMSVTKQQYLADGSVQVELRGDLADVELISKKMTFTEDSITITPTKTISGPKSVTLNEWQKLIENMVRFTMDDDLKEDSQ